jgi:hypothetical protein
MHGLRVELGSELDNLPGCHQFRSQLKRTADLEILVSPSFSGHAHNPVQVCTIIMDADSPLRKLLCNAFSTAIMSRKREVLTAGFRRCGFLSGTSLSGG